MSDKLNLSMIGNAIRIQINATELQEIEDCIAEAEACLSTELKKNPKAYLQTFVTPNHLAELQFFLMNGYYIENTLLTMECDLDREWAETDADIHVDTGILDIDHELTEYIKADGLGFETTGSHEKVSEQLSKPGAKVYIARVKKNMVSAVTTWQEPDNILCTENIFTIPKYRGKHIAAALLSKILKAGRAEGYKKARLTVYGDNVEAISLYLNMGYVVTDTIYELVR